MELRRGKIHHRIAQILPVRHAEIRAALADDHLLERILMKRRKKHIQFSPAAVGLAERRRHERREHIPVPVLPGQSRERLPFHHMPAEFINIPVESRIRLRIEHRHRHKRRVLGHGERLRLLLHIVDDEIPVIPQRRREEHQALGPFLLQRLPRLLVRREKTAVVADAAHESRKAEPPGVVVALRKRRQRLHKESVILLARRGHRGLDPRADAPDDLSVFLAERRICISIIIKCHR